MHGSKDRPAAAGRRGVVRARAAAGCVFGLLATVGAWWFLSSHPAEEAPQASDEPVAEIARRDMIDGLVAAIEAQSRAGRADPTVQAPPTRDRVPARRPVPAGAAERPPAPDGYAYPAFELARKPTKPEESEYAAAEEIEPPPQPDRPAWLHAPSSDASATIAANAAAAGRDWSFGWVRLGAAARVEDTAAELAALGVVVEGQAGGLLRARLPGDPDRLQAVVALPAVAGLGAQPPSAKLPAAFAEEARSKPAHEIVPVFVTLAAADDGDGNWRAGLERLGAVVGAWDAHTRSYTANVEYGGLDALTTADFVVYVEPVGIVEAAHDTAVPAMGADAYRTWTEADGWAGTAGQGVAIGVMDTGLNINHVDIESGRLSVCGANFVGWRAEEQDLWEDANGHGTHVTGTVAGNGTAERRYAGMAPLVPHIRFAKVLSRGGFGSDRSIIPGMDFLAAPSACGAAGWTDDAVAPPIVNMSLAANSRLFEGRDVSARKLDAVVWDTGQLYVVANSNSGVHGFSQYGAAKNSLPVGAAFDSGELAGFSSRGPTADGRLAPLVVGTGVAVNSAKGDGSRGGYVSLGGTSMASPAVAGVAALVMDANSAFAGNAALTRALLMASAVKPDAWLAAGEAFPSDNTRGPGPLNARYGLGKVSATTSVFNRAGEDGWQSGGWHGIDLDTGETSGFAIDVPPGASRLDIVMTWDEPPADVIANTVLNDLDLVLRPPYPATSAADLSSRSRVDNVEWIIVEDPQPGRWQVRAEAVRVHGESPRAALAYAVIRGPSTPQLSIVADRDTLGGRGGDIELTVSADGYVAAGARLVMECRTESDGPCYPSGNLEELQDGAWIPTGRSVDPGTFVALGEIRAGESRAVRIRGIWLPANARLHFTVTGWNARAGSVVVYRDEGEGSTFAAPPNDDFANAADLGADLSVAGDLLTATTEPGEPGFVDGAERPAASVWYRWKASAAGPVHFSLAPAEGFRYAPLDGWYRAFETRIDVYDGESIAGARQVASAPWGASFVAERDGEYLVRVSSRARMAPFALSWRRGGAPDNDAFAAAVVLTDGEGAVSGTNAGATLEPGERFGPLAATVWYEWTAPEDGWYQFESSAAHLRLLAFRDAPGFGHLRLVSANPRDSLRFPARAGDAYRVAVASANAESAGTAFELSWSALEDHGSSNDLFENASAFADAGSSSQTVWVDAMTVEPGEPAESGIRTEWWSWSPPATGEYTWRLPTPNLRLTAFEGDALDGLVSIGSSAGRIASFTIKAEQEQPYRFAVAAVGDAAFRYDSIGSIVYWGSTPSNDTLARAAVLDAAAGTLRVSNQFATIEPGERIRGVGHSSLWWSFRAPRAGWYRFRVDEGAPFTLSAYADDPDAPPGRLDMTASSERGIADGVEVFLHAAEAGERFAVRVGTRGDAEGREFTLRWEESDGPVWLRYLGHTPERWHHELDGATVEVSDFWSLALDPSGRALFAGTNQGLAVFERAGDDGSLDLVSFLRRGLYPRLLWDAPRNRLLAFEGRSVRSYVPVGGDVLNLEDNGAVDFVEGSNPYDVNQHDSTVFAHPSGSFLYFVDRHRDMQVFSIGEDGALAHVQTNGRLQAVAVSNDGGRVFGVQDGSLHVFESGETGELTETASVSLPYAHEAVAVAESDDRVIAWGSGGASFVDLGDPARPSLLGTVELPREKPWRAPRCLVAAAARNGRPAADVFCQNGDAYALEWRRGRLAVTDVVADWHANRYNDLVPDFRSWSQHRGFAASPDGRHAYSSNLGGILMFERVNNADDHADFPDTRATPVATLPYAADGEIERTGDRDVFRVELDGPGTLTIRTTGATDTHGRLTDAAGQLLDEDDDSGDETNFEIQRAVEAGTYYVEVRGSSAETTGSYSLSIEFTADRNVSFADARVITNDTDYPWSLHAADLDGDADADVLSASGEDDKIAWYENDGTGSFSAQRVLTTEADGARRVRVADLDGDGDLDVLAASEADDRVAWFENLGEDSFSEQRTISTDVEAPQSLQAADLDGDGDADVLSASGFNESIAWFENRGNGEYSDLLAVADDVADAAQAVDFDGDGDADVLAIRTGIGWYENDGAGAFGERREIEADVSPDAVHGADMDGDGDPDVLAAIRDDGSLIVWYENTGGGAFSERRSIAAASGSSGDSVNWVHAADLDGDRDADVLIAKDNEIAWYANEGGGGFSAASTIAEVSGGDTVYARDLDGDGDLDVLSQSHRDDKIEWHENLSDHGDDHGDTPASATLASALPAFLHGTLESGGDRDVFRFATGRGTLRVYTNGPTDTYGTLLDADGETIAENDDEDGESANFRIEREVEAGVRYVEVRGHEAATTGPYTVSVEFVAAADDHADTRAAATVVATLPYAGDGRLERSGDVDVFRVVVDGPGRLAVRTTGDTDTSYRLTDADGQTLAEHNGADWIRADVAAGTYYVEVSGTDDTTGPYTLSIEFAEADATLRNRHLVFSKAGESPDFAIGVDLDGDADPDVLASAFGSNNISWFANDGSGAFSGQQVITTDVQVPLFLHAADLDGDGDADLLSASRDDDKIAWHENQGGGILSEQRVISSEADSPVCVYAADLDGDGDADVLFAASNENDIRWYRNDGGGSFGEQRIVSDSEGALCVVPADLDGDGDADVLAAPNNASDLAWYRNDGDGSFSTPQVIATDVLFQSGGGGSMLHAADLDADGDVDVLSASARDDKVAWYENQGEGSFSAQRAISTTADYVLSVHAADLDGDGDGDVLSASHYDHKIAWYENRGESGFSGERLVTDNAQAAYTVFAVDLDGDGDHDALYASSSDDAVAWYENVSDHGDDHGDAPESATLAVALPAFLHGTVESAGDKDVFRFATGAGTLRASSNGPTDTIGRLLDADGEELATNDDLGSGFNFAIEADVAAGAHYLEVGGYSSTTGSYTLSIEFVAD